MTPVEDVSAGRPLKVVVDATAIPGRRVGVGAYVVELLRAVEADAVDLHVFVKQDAAQELQTLLPAATVHAVRVEGRPARMAWGSFVLPARVRGLRADVFHGPHYTVPARLSCPAVVTFHDPTFFTLPHLHERKKVAYFTRAAKRGVKRAARVIAVSEYSRRGAIEHAGAEPSRVDVVYEGVDLDRYRPSDGGSRERNLLFVGTMEPRKDVPNLVAAYDALDVDCELVLVGPPGWGTAAIEDAILRAKKRLSIRRTGYVSEAEKIDLYQNASAFVYPSLAEGFGRPVLEAMACGVPVVTTTGSAPEEIAGDAAVLVPPGDVVALRDAIARVLGDEPLAHALRKRGPERARRYTWDAAASATIDVWRKAAAG
jgi:glycosyltransferase involved in cell wall biosynthesis